MPVWSHLISPLFRPAPVSHLKILEDFVHQWVPPSRKKKRAKPAILNSTVAKTDSSKTCQGYVVETAPKTGADSAGKTDFNTTDNSKVDGRANAYREMEDGDEVDSAEEADDSEETEDSFQISYADDSYSTEDDEESDDGEETNDIDAKSKQKANSVSHCTRTTTSHFLLNVFISVRYKTALGQTQEVYVFNV